MRGQALKLERVSQAAWCAADVQLKIHELLKDGETCLSPMVAPLCHEMDDLRSRFESPEEHWAIVTIGGSLAMRRLLASEQGMNGEQYDSLVHERQSNYEIMRRERVDESIVLGISDVALHGNVERFMQPLTTASAA